VTTGDDRSGVGFVGLDHLNLDWNVHSEGKYTIEVRSSGYIGDYAFSASGEKL
jgi:hypothetical protein